MALERKGVDSTVRGAQIQSDALLQTKNIVSFEREPLLKEIPDQGYVLATVSGTVYIYARIGINRYKVAMTLV
jgi:hypothetical protein